LYFLNTWAIEQVRERRHDLKILARLVSRVQLSWILLHLHKSIQNLLTLFILLS